MPSLGANGKSTLGVHAVPTLSSLEACSMALVAALDHLVKIKQIRGDPFALIPLDATLRGPMSDLRGLIPHHYYKPHVHEASVRLRLLCGKGWLCIGGVWRRYEVGEGEDVTHEIGSFLNHGFYPEEPTWFYANHSLPVLTYEYEEGIVPPPPLVKAGS